MNITSIDLNLLLVLRAVFQERSVVAAARTLHVTPPAVSNALSRLRGVLGDPLFVRSGRGLVATPRALELGPAVERALAELQRALGDEPFDPAQTTREFTIAMADSDQIALLPALTAAFLRELPRARLRVISVDALISGGGLRTTSAELAIAPALDEPELHSQLLYEEQAVVLARRDHPRLRTSKTRARRTLSPELFSTLRHVDTHIALGRPGVGHREASDVFARHGFVRDIALVVPTFSAAAMVAAQTDLIAALPRSVANTFAALSPLQVLELPGVSMKMKLHIVWHARTHRDPGVRFVRDLIARTNRLKAAPS